MATNPETARRHRIEAAKRYMQVYHHEDDTLIEQIFDAAIVYLEGAGIARPSTGYYLYDVALWGIMLSWYDHRETIGSAESLPAGTRLIINQLKPVTF